MGIGEMWGLAVEAPKMYSAWVNDVAGGNDFLAGTLGVAALGVIGYACHSVPNAIYNLIKRRIVLSIMVDNTESAYFPLLASLNKHTSNSGSRDFTIEENSERSGEYADSFISTSGIGFHFFFHEYRLFWYSIADLESAGVTMQKKRITLWTFGVNKKTFDKFLRIMEKPIKRNVVSFYNSNGTGGISFIGRMRPQTIDEICLNEEVRGYIKKLLDDFLSTKSKIESLGIPDKLVLVLHGEPGNGKSRLIPAIAHYIKKEVNNINVAGLTSVNGFQESICNTDFVHVLEDIHSVSSLKKKSKKGVSYIKKEAKTPEEPCADVVGPVGTDFDLSIQLSEFLNVLNGSVPLNGQVIIMTTNYIDDLDQAILRPGRTDYVVKLPRIRAEVVNSWLKIKIPEFDETKGFTKSIRGCDIGGLLQTTYGDLEKINKQIPLIESKIPHGYDFEFNDTNNIEFD